MAELVGFARGGGSSGQRDKRTLLERCIAEIWKIFNDANKLFNIIDDEQNPFSPDFIFVIRVRNTKTYEELIARQLDNCEKLEQKWQAHGFESLYIEPIKVVLKCIKFPNPIVESHMETFISDIDSTFTENLRGSGHGRPSQHLNELQDIDYLIKEQIKLEDTVIQTTKRLAKQAADAARSAYRRFTGTSEAWHAIAKLTDIAEQISIKHAGHGRFKAAGLDPGHNVPCNELRLNHAL